MTSSYPASRLNMPDFDLGDLTFKRELSADILISGARGLKAMALFFLKLRLDER
ncbi:hypothetical protein L0128_16170 [candidate division KSB1 bacterium]|nr:hypothetical protein [candidate division KSB1 bacterium]